MPITDPSHTSSSVSKGRDENDAWQDVLRQLDATLDSPPTDASGYAPFELDFENSLSHQLGPFFTKLKAAVLNPENIAGIATKARGAYYLLQDGRLVYIGKSDAETGLRARLERHYSTLRHRKGVDISRVTFKAVKIASFSAIDTESLLLGLNKRMGEALTGSGSNPAWNYSGFGSNDTGRERDTQKVSTFDQLHPLDIDARIDLAGTPRLDATGSLPLNEYLRWLAASLTFIFRFPKSPELSAVTVNFAEMTASNVLRDLVLILHKKLPLRWSITVLRGKAVLYKDDSANYKSPIWRLEAGSVAGLPDYTLRTPTAAAGVAPGLSV